MLNETHLPVPYSRYLSVKILQDTEVCIGEGSQPERGQTLPVKVL